jgi:hypothetical protein
MTSISIPSGDEANVSSPADIIDVDTVNNWLDQLKLIGVELRDDNGEIIIVTEENASKVAEAVKAVAAEQATVSDGNEDADDEDLPPFTLPAAYLDTSNRESLSESSAYAEHLNEHWGF